MTNTGTDEYMVLVAFLCGMLAHGFLVVGTPRRIAGTLGIFVASAVTSWLLVEFGTGEWLEVLFFTAIIHAVVFAIVYRAQLMPVVSVAGLVHYTMLMYYAVSLSARAAAVDLPTSILVVGAIPAVFVVILALVGPRAGPGTKKLAYAWFLILLTGLIIHEMTLLAEHGPRRGEAPIAEAAAWFFFLGPLWLYFVSNIVYLIMMLPAQRASDAVLWRAILGDDDVSVDAQHRVEAAKRITVLGITPFRLALLAVHALILAGNWVYGLVPHGIVISVSIVALAQLESRSVRRLRSQPLTATR